MAMSQQSQPFHRQKPKKEKVHPEWHVAKTKYGMGDNYGTGIKAKIGRVREDMVGMSNVSKKQIKTPPKSVA